MTTSGPARDPEDVVRAVVSALPDVAAAIVFGSRAVGDADARSDLDLALACPGVGTRRWLEIADAVEAADTLIRIDLVRLDDAPPTLRDEIRRTGRTLYERPPA